MRDTLQRQLCGADTGEAFGTGLVPLESFSRKPIMVSGGLQAVDTFHVTHATDGKIDGMTTATFKTFEMRREKFSPKPSIWCGSMNARTRPSTANYMPGLVRAMAT